jgi:hypothetical protein
MPGALEPGEQLEWERRAGRPAGIAATLAAACLLIGLLYTTLVGAEAKFSVYERAIQANDQPHLVIVPTALQAIGYLLFAYALYYLARATRARRSETPRWAPGLSAIAGVLKTITVVLTAIALVSISADTADLKLAPFTERGAGLAGLAANELAAERAAIDVRDDSSVLEARQIIVLVANLALGLALVLVGLNAMRAGLLSRFMGILGIIAGALTILFQGAGIIEAFWLAAIGTIFLDRWPNGRGPAWETGQATPWPSAMDQLPAEEAETETETGAEPEALAAEEEAAASPHPASRKRKRKKRR